jgi:hypothetical protein
MPSAVACACSSTAGASHRLLGSSAAVEESCWEDVIRDQVGEIIVIAVTITFWTAITTTAAIVWVVVQQQVRWHRWEPSGSGLGSPCLHVGSHVTTTGVLMVVVMRVVCPIQQTLRKHK